MEIKKNKTGRPKLQLDEKQILELAKIQCTMNEIASVMDCSISTLEKSFSGLIDKGKECGKSTLRRYMWKAVEKGNVTMMIWLSKQLLGMKEPEVEQKEENKALLMTLLNEIENKM